MKSAVRTFAKIVVGLVSLTLVAGLVIHLPPIKRWLAANGHHGTGVCPLGYGTAKKHVASVPGGSHPALGFALGTTTSAQVTQWATEHGITCTSRKGTQLECANVSGALLGDASAPAATVWFLVDDANVVYAIQTSRKEPSASPIAAAFARVTHDLDTARGAATKRQGTATAESLQQGLLRQAVAEYEAKDYRAVVRATNMGDGFVLTENYVLL
jgi:hypothetical protein